MEFKSLDYGGEGWQAARAVRIDVFCKEQGYSLENELDETDKTALHVVGTENGRAVCTGRVFLDGGAVHLGRIAVLKECRGKNVGTLLVRQMLAEGRKMGAPRCVLNAQADKTVFYEKLGFVKTGQTSLDEGVPHAEMVLEFS